MLQTKIQNAANLTDLKKILDNPEPRQPNGHKTRFARHLEDTLWYFDLPELQQKKDFAIKLCKFYKKL
jgi:hypothetical protein